MNDYAKEFDKEFASLCRSHNRHQVWSDFVVMSACAISNLVDSFHHDRCEDMYDECSRRYSPEEHYIFARLLAATALALKENPNQDFLGEVFSRNQLYSGRKGQFFTPYLVGTLMANLICDKEEYERKALEQGSISVCDSCCGAGCLLIATANIISTKTNIPKEQVVYFGQDIDQIAGLMCYIQLAFLGLRGYIKIANSLSDPISQEDSPQQDPSYWITPAEASWSAKKE